MALNIIEGLMGAGKSCVAVNFIMLDELQNGTRHVYTNLPIYPERMARYLSGGRPAKAQAYLDRIHVLENRLEVVRDEEGKPLMVPESPKPGAPLVECRLNMVQSFWRFTRPGSIIIMDEAADIWNARNWKQTQAQAGVEDNELQSYINHHRHYKDDLYILSQAATDIDKQIRNKFQFIWVVSNSTKENMFDVRWLKGIKWPVQFFKIRVFHPREMKEPCEVYTFRPKAVHFSFYDSFSASHRLPGKALPDKGTASSDHGQSYLKRIANFRRNVGYLVLGGGFLAAIVVASYFAVMRWERNYGHTTVRVKANESKSAVKATEASADMPAKKADPTPPAQDTVDFVGVGLMHAGKHWYGVGDKFDGKEISYIRLDVVGFADGTFLRIR